MFEVSRFDFQPLKDLGLIWSAELSHFGSRTFLTLPSSAASAWVLLALLHKLQNFGFFVLLFHVWFFICNFLSLSEQDLEF